MRVLCCCCSFRYESFTGHSGAPTLNNLHISVYSKKTSDMYAALRICNISVHLCRLLICGRIVDIESIDRFE